ncbi:NAD(P)-dependent oxidoreductase [Cloacibacterium normanense]|uniref:dTDP-4-dehydrorhamnose reductase n=1 Tax=Cloacibacterium normanense TaxID=237258 RepID=A0A2S7I1X2_9FLAO|nr:SDR family oxidoreductase [Cloacibacterium normanense]PPZ90576.1 NAD(P)-dependent oxidoreductase [Cloacibacterium normanense]
MEKKRILIIGATGMLGHMVHKYFEGLENYELFNSVYRNPLNDKSIVCNVKDQNAVKKLFEQTKPDVVINCVGALVQESQNNPASAIYLNALFPYVLRDLSNICGAKLIHISTDCVFSGIKGAYGEDDFRDSDDVYGRSKALGEILDAFHCTLRTSIIGPELKDGTGLFHWFMKQEGEVKGYTHAFWGGVTTLELAKAIEKAIKYELNGVFQVTNGSKISKFDLLSLFNQYKVNPTRIVPFENYTVDKSLKKSNKFDFEVPNFDIQMKELQDFIKKSISYSYHIK